MFYNTSFKTSTVYHADISPRKSTICWYKSNFCQGTLLKMTLVHPSPWARWENCIQCPELPSPPPRLWLTWAGERSSESDSDWYDLYLSTTKYTWKNLVCSCIYIKHQNLSSQITSLQWHLRDSSLPNLTLKSESLQTAATLNPRTCEMFPSLCMPTGKISKEYSSNQLKHALSRSLLYMHACMLIQAERSVTWFYTRYLV